MDAPPSPDLLETELAGVPVEISSDLLASLLDQSQDCIKLLGPTGCLDYMNPNGLCIMEIDDFSTIAGTPWWTLWPQESQHLVRNAIEQARAGRHARFEAFCPTRKGTPRWWDVGVSPVKDRHGVLVGIVSISRDVSERVAAREQLQAMAYEMRHRLRNAYAISASLARTSARAQPEHKTFAADLADRFSRLATAQSRMIDAVIDGDRLPVLIPALTEAFGGGSGGLSVLPLPDVAVAEQSMRAIALLLGELCTNSLKHGALGRGGSVVIAGELAGPTLILQWTENSGVPRGQDSTRVGDGMQLMRRIVQAHAGQLDFNWRSDGLDVTATLSID